MIKSCSKYFGIKLHLFVWQIWDRKDNTTYGYKNQSPFKYFGIKLHFLSLTHVGKKYIPTYWYKNFEDFGIKFEYFEVKLQLSSLIHDNTVFLNILGKSCACFVWHMWVVKDNTTCWYKKFEWLDVFTTVKNVKDWKLVLWLDWVSWFELWQNLWFQTHYL